MNPAKSPSLGLSLGILATALLPALALRIGELWT